MDPTRRGRQSGMRGLPGARGDRPAGALEPLLSSRFAPPRRGGGTDSNWQVVASWRVSPARARNASGQGVSLSVLGAVRAAELRSGSMGSILSNRTDSGCVTRSNPISASRTASRFGFCQAFCDPLGPVDLQFSQQLRCFLGILHWRDRLRGRRSSRLQSHEVLSHTPRTR